MKIFTYTNHAAIVALALGTSSQAFAQAAAVEWSSVAKITNGNCGDGAIAQVVEVADGLNIKTSVNGKQTGDFKVTLAPDGSGSVERTTMNGRTILEVPAGKGKRLFRTRQLEGTCQWTWSPK